MGLWLVLVLVACIGHCCLYRKNPTFLAATADEETNGLKHFFLTWGFLGSLSVLSVLIFKFSRIRTYFLSNYLNFVSKRFRKGAAPFATSRVPALIQSALARYVPAFSRPSVLAWKEFLLPQVTVLPRSVLSASLACSVVS